MRTAALETGDKGDYHEKIFYGNVDWYFNFRLGIMYTAVLWKD